MTQFDEKDAVVTGGAHGIGKAIDARHSVRAYRNEPISDETAEIRLQHPKRRIVYSHQRDRFLYES